MNRRNFIKKSVLGAGLGITGVAAACSVPQEPILTYMHGVDHSLIGGVDMAAANSDYTAFGVYVTDEKGNPRLIGHGKMPRTQIRYGKR